MDTKLKSAALDLSAAGLLGTYLTLREVVPQVELIPPWVVLLVIMGAMIGRGVYKALKDDGHISLAEAAAIFGLAREELVSLRERATAAGIPDRLGPDDVTSPVDVPRA